MEDENRVGLIISIAIGIAIMAACGAVTLAMTTVLVGV